MPTLYCFLERLSYDRKEAIVKDKETMAKVKKVYKMFRDYMDVKPNAKRPSVAYFCMEYGINRWLRSTLVVWVCLLVTT